MVMVMVMIAIIIFIWFVFYVPYGVDEFTQNLNRDPLHYKELLIPTTTKQQRYLSFLSELNDNFKNKIPQTGPFRGTCNDKLNQVLQNESLKEVFNKQVKSNNLENEFKRDPCIAVSNHLCQFTDPKMYLSESQIPPRWLMKSLRDKPLPHHVDLSCFNRTYNCCKQSK